MRSICVQIMEIVGHRCDIMNVKLMSLTQMLTHQTNVNTRKANDKLEENNAYKERVLAT